MDKARRDPGYSTRDQAVDNARQAVPAAASPNLRTASEPRSRQS